MLSRSELNVSSSPIWDSADPQRRPPPLPMREEFPLNHIDTSGKLSRTSSVSSHLHRQIIAKSPSQILRTNSDEKTIDTIHTISETTNTILTDLHALIERSKDNASTLADLKKSIDITKHDQEILDEMRNIIASCPKMDNKENEYYTFEEKLDKILQLFDTKASTYTETQQLLIDINKRLEAIEISQEKLHFEKLEVNHLASSFETLQRTNITEMEDIYRRKIEMSTELARLNTHIDHKRSALNQLEERVKILENRLIEIQVKLNKQREENRKLRKSSVIKKKIHPPTKCPTTPQNTRHFSLSDIHNRNPSVVALAPSTVMNTPSDNGDSIIFYDKAKRKTSWSKKVANIIGLSFQHNNKENSPTFLQNSEKTAQGKRRNYPNDFKIKSAKAFRSFSTRV